MYDVTKVLVGVGKKLRSEPVSGLGFKVRVSDTYMLCHIIYRICSIGYIGGRRHDTTHV